MRVCIAVSRISLQGAQCEGLYLKQFIKKAHFLILMKILAYESLDYLLEMQLPYVYVSFWRFVELDPFPSQQVNIFLLEISWFDYLPVEYIFFSMQSLSLMCTC